jgi:hypothetical protein
MQTVLTGTPTSTIGTPRSPRTMVLPTASDLMSALTTVEMVTRATLLLVL